MQIPLCPCCGKPIRPKAVSPFSSGPILWNYGSGFPKSHDISKAIDKAAGAKREIVGESTTRLQLEDHDDTYGGWKGKERTAGGGVPITAPATDAARQWSGWGTALKPAWEPIILARKPRRGTYAECAVEHGAGALWVDGCRVDYNGEKPNIGGRAQHTRGDGYGFKAQGEKAVANTAGRWPANVILSHHPDCVRVGAKKIRGSHRTGLKEGEVRLYGTNSWFGGGLKDLGTDYTDPDGLETIEDWECVEDCPIRLLNEQAGPRRNPGSPGRQAIYPPGKTVTYGRWHPQGPLYFDAGEKGNASRFFYTAKSSRRERNAGLEGLEVLKLRDDLTGDEMSFVLSELERLGVKPLQQ